MANQTLKIDVVAQDKSKRALNQVQGNLQRVRQSVFNLRNAFIGLGAGVVVKGFVDAGIQIENLGVQLKALFGSATKGKEALEAVTKFAATTPFELRNIQQGITALATVAERAEKSGISFEELLKITGNTATVLGGDFALASLQIQRSFSAGIGSAELFRERGVRAMAGFKEGVAVNTEQSIQGLAKAFGSGGKFGNLTNELAQTLFGTVSNIKDAFFQFQVSVAEGFFGALKENLGDLKKTVEENKKSISEFGAMIGSGLSSAINATASAFKFFKENLDLIVNAIKILIAFKLIKFFLDLTIAIKGTTTAMLAFNAATRKNLIIGGAAVLLSQLDKIVAKLRELGLLDEKEKLPKKPEQPPEVDVFPAKKETLFEAAIRNLKDFRDQLEKLNKGEIEKFQTKMTTIGSIIAKGLNAGIKKTSDALARSIILGENLAESFRKMAQELAVRVLSAIIEIIARKTVELAIEKLITREKEKQRNLSAASGNPLAILSFFGGFSQGGAVSKNRPIVVGERGPELFVPNQTGQITQNARGTNGQPVSVNFNINAIDSTGFEEVLINNRGTITAIINNALNEQGKASLV
tara:strand:+ start:29 stop:1777 length:1749 start_codon:yes stop_codon:yes gene_type:complete